jgi:hypothetical protein
MDFNWVNYFLWTLVLITVSIDLIIDIGKNVKEKIFDLLSRRNYR